MKCNGSMGRKQVSKQSNQGLPLNTMSLRGMPTCPCCGAQLGVVICECGNIMCSDGNTTACPWCGLEGSLGEIAEGGMDITRGRGQALFVYARTYPHRPPKLIY